MRLSKIFVVQICDFGVLLSTACCLREKKTCFPIVPTHTENLRLEEGGAGDLGTIDLFVRIPDLYLVAKISSSMVVCYQ